MLFSDDSSKQKKVLYDAQNGNLLLCWEMPDDESMVIEKGRTGDNGRCVEFAVNILTGDELFTWVL